MTVRETHAICLMLAFGFTSISLTLSEIFVDGFSFILLSAVVAPLIGLVIAIQHVGVVRDRSSSTGAEP